MTDRQKSVTTVITLFLVVGLSIFLRYEDFMDWQKNKPIFQYEGEYIMGGLDAYINLQHAKDIDEGTYDTLDEKRKVPNGVIRPAIPPLLSMITVAIHRITGIPLSTVALFLPIFLSALIVPLVYHLARKLKFSRTGALVATFFSVISITDIARTRIGFFDTDCLNVVFVLLNSYLFLSFAESQNNNRYKYVLLAILNTFLFYIFWYNAGSIVMFSFLAPLFVAFIFYFKTKKKWYVYGFLALVGGICLYIMKEEVVKYLDMVLGNKQGPFHVQGIIGELKSVNLSGYIEGTFANRFLYFLIVVGGIYFFIKQKRKALFFIVPVGLGLLPFFAGIRFLIFATPVLALGIGSFVELLYRLKSGKRTKIVYLSGLFIMGLGLYSNYHKITYKIQEVPFVKSKPLLSPLKMFTPENANIWTSWGIGNQILYYLDKNTYADGEFTDGEIFYYLHFPLAADNFALSANFMRFYSTHGKKGMEKLYALFETEAKAFSFLKKIHSKDREQARPILHSGLTRDNLPKTGGLETASEWTSFLYPEQTEDIYLFLHQMLLQRSTWFKQGTMDLHTGKTEGIAFFQSFFNLQKKGTSILSNEFKLDLKTGEAITKTGGKFVFGKISTFDGKALKTTQLATKSHLEKQNPYVFIWNSKTRFGAIISKDVAKTTLMKLFMEENGGGYFEPVSLSTPSYQIWKIKGMEQ